MTQLSGTGRLADDLYLLAHHDMTGKPHLQPRAAGLGLAGALLAELALAGAAGIVAGAVMADQRAQPEDRLGRDVLGLIAAESKWHPVQDWLAFLSRTAADDVAARLASAGYLVPARSRRPRRAARWAPADADCAFAPFTRVKSALHSSGPPDPQAVTLAGLAAACGLGPRLALYLPPGTRDRIDALVPLLDPGLAEVITQTQAAVDAALLAHRI
jgi:hypothetical protein